MAAATGPTRAQQESPQDCLPQLFFSPPVQGLRAAYGRCWDSSESPGPTCASVGSLLVLGGPRAHPAVQLLLQQEWEPRGEPSRVKGLVFARSTFGP